MATAPFNLQHCSVFSKPDKWQKWKRRFQQYRMASGLSEKRDECQASTLLYYLGVDTEDILTTTCILDENRKKYSKVLEKFDKYFQVRHNVIFERTCLNKRNQQSGKSAENSITILHQLMDSCEYGKIKDEMIRNRLVVDIKDDLLSERLQMESNLMLDKAKTLIRQREAVQQQQGILKGNGYALEAVNTKSKKKFKKP